MTAFIVSLLAALDLARPYAGPSLRPLSWLAGVAALCWLAARLSAAGRGLRQALPEIALAALLLPVYVQHSRALDSDGIHYYAYLRSLLFDQDLDLANDYRLLGYDERHKNVLPVGAPMLWAPFVAPVFVAAQAARLFGAPAPTGVEPVFQAAVALGTFACAAAGLFLLMDALRHWVSPAAAFWTSVLCWLGSPLRFYLSVLPSMAHGAEFFAAALVLRASLRLRAEPSRRHALLAGAACGLVFLVRSQDGLLLGLPAALLLPALLRQPSRRAALEASAALLLAFGVVALPQLAVWQAMYGTPFLVPHKVIHGAAFLHLESPELFSTLFSPRGGLLASYPVQLAALIALLALARRDPPYVVAALPVLLAMWYVNSTIFDWYQVRRFTGVVPLLAPGLAWAVAPLVRAGPLPLALVAFLAWRYDLAIDSLRSQPGQPAPVRAAVSRLADGLASAGYAVVEPGAPGAAVRLLGAYTGEPLLDEPVSRVELARDPSLLRLPLPARHLSQPEVEDGKACRWVQGDIQASLFLPLAWTGEVSLTFSVRPLLATPETSMEVVLNDRSLGRTTLADGWQEHRFSAEPGVARLGTNVLVVRFDRAPVYRRVRGIGPRQVRPAALAEIVLRRGEPGEAPRP